MSFIPSTYDPNNNAVYYNIPYNYHPAYTASYEYAPPVMTAPDFYVQSMVLVPMQYAPPLMAASFKPYSYIAYEPVPSRPLYDPNKSYKNLTNQGNSEGSSEVKKNSATQKNNKKKKTSNERRKLRKLGSEHFNNVNLVVKHTKEKSEKNSIIF